LGKIIFEQFLSTPNLSAPPTPASTPTTTPIPTRSPTPTPTITPHPTATPTSEPTIALPSPTQTSDQTNPIVNDAGGLLNFSLMIKAVEFLLVVTWVVVIFGYIAKNYLIKFKTRKRKDG